MLSRKTLGVAGAAMLGAVAFLGTNSASAVINLEDGMGAVKYAKETLTVPNEFMLDGVTYYAVPNGNSNKLDMSGKLGFRPSTTAPVHVRFDLINMVLAGNSLGDGDLTGGTTQRTAGGLGGVTGGFDNYVIYTVTGLASTNSDVVELQIKVLGLNPDQPGSVKFRVYLDVSDALAGNDNYLRMKEVSSAVSVVSGVKVTVTKGMDIAEVADNFEKFVGSATVGKVGTIMVTYDGDTLNGANANSANVNNTNNVFADAGTTITVMGDFSEAVGQHHDSADGCTTPGTDLNSTTGEVSLDLAKAKAAGGVSVCLEETADKQIPAAPYTVAVKFAGVKDKKFAAPEFMGELGGFERNGTTVHIPYMTTYDGYNQRLVLSNRGTTDVAYEIEFRPEEGVTATGMDMAMGTLMAGATVTMKTTDLVTLEGGSRTAATINLVADPSNIDVTSVIVNMETRDTDTVVHHSGM